MCDVFVLYDYCVVVVDDVIWVMDWICYCVVVVCDVVVVD